MICKQRNWAMVLSSGRVRTAQQCDGSAVAEFQRQSSAYLSSGASKPARSGRFKSSHLNHTRITCPCKPHSCRPCREGGSLGR